MDHQLVAEHYNSRVKETRGSRRKSPIYHMRQFNNWLKFILIDLHSRPGDSVLDLCCGKGGDLHKWGQVLATNYVGCDIAKISVSEAINRFNNIDKATSFRPSFLVGDCFHARLSEFLPPATTFDIVSCQFSMHYAFENEERVRRLLENITDRLKPGGFFIGTSVDSNVVIRKIRAINDLQISSSVYSIRFDESHADKRFPTDRSPFGIRYFFTLDENVKDCPEFLVHFPTFIKLAEEYDLIPIMISNFHQFFAEFSNEQYYKTYHQLLYTMNVVDEHGSISPDEWDAIYLYVAFAFKKRSTSESTTEVTTRDVSNIPKKQWPPIDADEIIDMNK